MKRKEILRGPGSPPRQIDEVRKRRGQPLQSQAALGNEFATDGKQKLRLRTDALGIDSLAEDVDTIKEQLGLDE